MHMSAYKQAMVVDDASSQQHLMLAAQVLDRYEATTISGHGRTLARAAVGVGTLCFAHPTAYYVTTTSSPSTANLCW